MAIVTRPTRFLEPLLYCLAYFRYTFTSLENIDEDHVFMLLVIIREYAWKMHQSRARENYRKTFRKTSYQWRFRGVGKQSTNFLFLWH